MMELSRCYLQKLTMVRSELRNVRDALDVMESTLDHCKSVPDVNIADYVCRSMQLREQISDLEHREDKIRAELSLILSYIQKAKYRRVIYLRHVKEMQWKEIAAELHVNERTAFRFYDAALFEMGQILAKNQGGYADEC